MKELNLLAMILYDLKTYSTLVFYYVARIRLSMSIMTIFVKSSFTVDRFGIFLEIKEITLSLSLQHLINILRLPVYWFHPPAILKIVAKIYLCQLCDLVFQLLIARI